MVQTRTIKERVNRGVAFLDKVKPGWHKKISLKNFQIDDTCKCIVGQVFKRHKNSDYFESPFLIGIRKLDLSCDQVVKYGFDRNSEDENEYDLLQKYWLLALEEKLNANSKSKTTRK